MNQRQMIQAAMQEVARKHRYLNAEENAEAVERVLQRWKEEWEIEQAERDLDDHPSLDDLMRYEQ